VPAFASLPVATVEAMAVRTRRAIVTDGSHIVRQGEVGDAFFVIEQGSVEV
jgi:CRP-like cAMP-binding protein